MGENAILELRTVNIGEDVTSFLRGWGIPYSPERVVINTKMELERVDNALLEILRLAGFASVNGSFQHSDGSRIEKIAGVIEQKDEDAEALLENAEWCSARYRGYGNPLTVTPVIRAIKDYYERNGLKTVLDRF